MLRPSKKQEMRKSTGTVKNSDRPCVQEKMMKRMIKKTVSVVLALCITMTMLPLSSMAAEETVNGAASGSCGTNLTWKIEDNVLTISGTGEMSFSNNNAPWKSYRKSITGIVVEEGVTSLAQYAFFAEYDSLTSIVLPDGLKRIEKMAIGANASTKPTINIPDSVEYLGDSALSNVKATSVPSSLKYAGEKAFGTVAHLDVVIPACTEYIGPMAFDGFYADSITVDPSNENYDSRNDCNAIIETATATLVCGCKNTVIPQGTKIIGKGAFSSAKFETIDIPEGVVTIEERAFDNTALKSIDLPSSLEYIGDYAFESTYITQLHIPALVTHIGVSICNTWNDKTSITVDPSNTVYDSRNDCNAIIEKNNKTYGGPTVILGCSVTVIPTGVKAIGPYAFSYSKVRSLDVPEGVVTIAGHAFYNSDIKNISLPRSLKTVEVNAFLGTTPEKVKYNGTKSQFSSISFPKDPTWGETGNESLLKANIAYQGDIGGDETIYLSINGNGRAFTRHLVRDEFGNVLKNTPVTCLYHDVRRAEETETDNEGYVTLSWANDKDQARLTPNAEPYKKEIQVDIYEGTGHDFNQAVSAAEGPVLLPGRVTLRVTVNPLSFKQTWKGVYSESLTGAFAAGGKVNVDDALDVDFSLASVEGEAGSSPSIKLINEYVNGQRNVKLTQTVDYNFSFKGDVGPGAKLKAANEGFGLTPYSIIGKVKGNFGQIYGIEIEDYNPYNASHIKDIGECIFGSYAIAKGNQMLLDLASLAGFDAFDVFGGSNSFTLTTAQKADGFSIDRLHGSGELMGKDQDSVYYQSVTRNDKTGEEKMEQKKTSKYTQSEGNFKFKFSEGGASADVKQSLLEDTGRFSEYSLSKTYKGRGTDADFTLSKVLAFDEHSVLLKKNTERETFTLKYSNDEYRNIYAYYPELRKLINSDKPAAYYFVMDSAMGELMEKVPESPAAGTYSIKESKGETLSLPPLTLGLTNGFASIGVKFSVSGEENTEYESQGGSVQEGEYVRTYENDIEKAVEANRVGLETMIKEPLETYIKLLSEYISIKTAPAREWIREKNIEAGGANKGYVNVASVNGGGFSSGGGRATNIYVYKKYPLLGSGDTISGNTIFSGEATVVGDPYYVYLSEDAEGKNVIDDFSDSPITLKLSYNDLLLSEEGLDREDAGKIAIYEYSDVVCGYVHLDGEFDAENRTYTVKVTKPGQFLLAAPVSAGKVQELTRVKIGESGYEVAFSPSVSYNGASHVQEEAKASKSKCADVILHLYDPRGNEVKATDYKVVFRNNKNVATAKKQPYFTIKLNKIKDPALKAAFKQTKIPFVISPMDLSQTTPQYKSVVKDKTGSLKVNGLWITGHAGKKLKLRQVNKKGTGDFEVSGTPEAPVITGKGNYSGTIKL